MTTQAVNDLLWVVNSPSFVTGDSVAPAADLSASDVDPEALQAFLDERPAHRVGRYFENLLHFWLRDIRKVDMVGAGVQVRDGKRTIGELDFLYRNESGVLIHCEAAVKFFLHLPRPGVSHFPGPNATDNFERKAEKLFKHQLEFSRAHYPEVERRHAFVKGIVFYRGDDRPETLPARMATDHLDGRWLRAEELARHLERANVVASIADKPHWLAPCDMTPTLGFVEIATILRDHFAGANPHPVMVNLRDPETLAEIERLCVVSHHWPAPLPRRGDL